MDLFEKAKARALKALTKAGIPWAIGGCDISCNEQKGAQVGRGYWQPHVVGFTPTSTLKPKTSKAFREGFKATPRVPRPVVMKPFNGNTAGLAYAQKTEFARRVTLPKVIDEKGSTAKRRNTRDRSLRARQKVELMLALDRAGLISRLVLHGVEIVVSKRGPRFRLIASPKQRRKR